MFDWKIEHHPEVYGSPACLTLTDPKTGAKVFEAYFDRKPGTLDDIQAQLDRVIAYIRRRTLEGRKA